MIFEYEKSLNIKYVLTSVHILCECAALASLRYTYLGSFFLDPENIRVLDMEAIWNFAKGTGLLYTST
jgi:hypothetical protein